MKDRIVEAELKDLVYISYGQYSVDTQTRGIPRIEDALKLSTRRVLYHMWKSVGTEKLIKAVPIVGEILGRYHPVGDVSVYGAMATLAQGKAAFPLIWGKGNWGDLRNSKDPAAYRYTECKAHPNLMNIVDDESMSRVGIMVPNFSDTTNEPYYIMAKIPLGLLNRTKGVVVGLTTEAPAHNVNEIIDASIAIIENKYEITSKNLAKILKAPDHSLYDSYMIVDKNSWLGIIETGKGNVQSCPKMELNDNIITVSALAYGGTYKNLEAMCLSIQDRMFKKHKKKVFKDCNNTTKLGKFGAKIILQGSSKKDADLFQEFYSLLMSKSMCKVRYSLTLCEQDAGEKPSLSDGSTYTTKTIGLRELLINFQERRRKFKLAALQSKLEELKMLLDCEDLKLILAKDSQKFLNLVTTAETTKMAIQSMVEKYKKSYEVCDRVLSNSGFSSYINKSERIMQTIERLEKDLKLTEHRIKHIDEYLIEELEQLKNKVGTKRVSEIKYL